MRKVTLTLINLLFAMLLTGTVFTAKAQAALSVRLEQPQTPTKSDTFNINFVALDSNTPGRVITVKCYKNGPSDGAVYSQFGSNIALTAGGGTGNCSVTSAVLSTGGSYNFKVIASATAPDESVENSPIVTVEYKPGGPGTPQSYTKQHLSDCQYKILFKTADDGGKTSKVEIYRSDGLSFNVDGSTRVGVVFIGSNLEGSLTNDVPCGGTYYYAIRAFDNAGNGSDVVGDSTTTTITVSPSPSALVGAIPVAGGQVLLGKKAAGETGAVLGGEATSSAEPTVSPSPTPAGAGLLSSLLTPKGIAVVAIALGLLFLLYSRSRQGQ